MFIIKWRSLFSLSYKIRPSLIIGRYYSFNSDTIFSLSSGHGKCGVSVIRVSGPKASNALLSLCGYKYSLPKPRLATYRKLIHPVSGDPLDRGLAIWFPGPKSFTGEDCVEFHVHGGIAVVMSVLNSLAVIPGLRHAEPGDFTKRALFNNKLDLTEVEGLADLIHAETETQRIQALRQMEGDLSNLYNTWRETLLQCMAHVEATIDFGEEENIEDGVLKEVQDKVKKLVKDIESHLSDGRRGERLRSGIHVSIIGPPNAGKSSLLNILCQRPAAIVSSYAGTTRDVVESSLDICGYPIVLCDTAGLRQSADPIESEGIKRALNKAETADLNLVIIDSSKNKLHLQSSWLQLLDQLLLELDINNKDRLTDILTAHNTIIVMNKIDLLEHHHQMSISHGEGPLCCWLSCTTEEGFNNFLTILQNKLKELGGDPITGSPLLTQTRHRNHLEDCRQFLYNFTNHFSLEEESDLVLIAEELRQAITCIGRITGKVNQEELLDIIFRDFCIGK